MNLKATIICFLLAVICSGCAQKSVESSPLEADSKVKREVFDAAKNPALMAVGKVNFIGQRWCSVVLVAEEIGVTAGHCFLKSNVKFDLSNDLEPFLTSVIFKTKDGERIENIHVKRLLKAEMTPDYAIVRFNKKIPTSAIKPLKISKLTFDEMRSDESRLGCAGFNGDREFGSQGLLMTISRNVKIVPDSNSTNRIDTNCFSTYGGSGGLFFRETMTENYEFIGVIWGMTDEKFNEKGELVKDENIVTSITPVSVFYDELREIIDKN